ncbi:MAG: hypothetical protein WC857_00790 [Candidatus Paceibacterota bacterium]|jgi:hypothetical protein
MRASRKWILGVVFFSVGILVDPIVGFLASATLTGTIVCALMAILTAIDEHK